VNPRGTGDGPLLRPGKRCLDVILGSVCLMAAAPLIGVCALTVRITSRGPAIFRQDRVGVGGEVFRIYKLRTMVDDAERLLPNLQYLNVHSNHGDTRMFKLEKDPRVTSVGRWMRRFSIDELPQLLNVVVGDMSLVGPRPLLPEEDRHVLGVARDRLRVRPGITGPWQVRGRNALPFERMLELDIDYVRTMSMVGDVKLLVQTIPAALRGEPDY
jgi:lipopolysaccharide/colanic/teichoic acid biosynthesis glycosyltransferase